MAANVCKELMPISVTVSVLQQKDEAIYILAYVLCSLQMFILVRFNLSAKHFVSAEYVLERP